MINACKLCTIIPSLFSAIKNRYENCKLSIILCTHKHLSIAKFSGFNYDYSISIQLLKNRLVLCFKMLSLKQRMDFYFQCTS